MDNLENYVKSLQQLYGKELKVAETDESFESESDKNYAHHLRSIGEEYNLGDNTPPKWLETSMLKIILVLIGVVILLNNLNLKMDIGKSYEPLLINRFINVSF